MKYGAALLTFLFLILGSSRSAPAEEWPKTAAECSAFLQKLRDDAPIAARYKLWREGLARFYGVCFKLDRWAGIDRVERAVTNGAEGASLDLVQLYSEIGDAQAVEKWRDLAAIFVWNHTRVGRENLHPESDPDGSIARAANDLAARLQTDDVTAIVARLEKLAARPPILVNAELYLWLALTRRLFDLESNENPFWSGLGGWRQAFQASSAQARDWHVDGAILRFLSATNCGDLRAARFLSGLLNLDRPDGDAPYSEIIKLAAPKIGQLHRLTGALTQEVAAVERQIGGPIFASDMDFDVARRAAANACPFPRVRGLRTQDETVPPRTAQ
jgi:hypothetical protein